MKDEENSQWLYPALIATHVAKIQKHFIPQLESQAVLGIIWKSRNSFCISHKVLICV